MKITISNESDDYCTFIDTDVQNVLITEAYIGPKLVTDDGEELSVCMRDNGFEITYIDDDNVEHIYSFHNGFVRRLSLKGKTARDTNVVPFKQKE